MLREDGEISTTVFEAGSAGNAGAITVAGQLLVQSVIEALSELGIDGTVNLEAPDTEIVGSLAVLPSAFLDAHARPAANGGGGSAAAC